MSYEVNRDEADDTIPSRAQAKWVEWSTSSSVDTGGRCTCGHEGLGVSWHLDTCPGAAYAFRQKVQELFEWLS